MNNRYAIYTSASGEIQFSVNANADEVAAAHCELDQSFVRATRPLSSRDYVNLDTKEIEERPISPYTLSANSVIADAESEIEITGMTPGTCLTINGPVSGNVDDVESQVFSFSDPGKYVITITAPFPAIPQQVTINATQ